MKHFKIITVIFLFAISMLSCDEINHERNLTYSPFTGDVVNVEDILSDLILLEYGHELEFDNIFLYPHIYEFSLPNQILYHRMLKDFLIDKILDDAEEILLRKESLYASSDTLNDSLNDIKKLKRIVHVLRFMKVENETHPCFDLMS